MRSFFKTISLLALMGGAQQAMAVPMDFDFSGNFSSENDVVLLDFSVANDSAVTVFSSSWDDGGLDPILAIWDSAGNLVSVQDDGLATGTLESNGVAYSYGAWDSLYNVFLAAGNYIASITMYDNFPVGNLLSDGFLQDGDPNFSAAFGCSNGVFCGFSGDNRTSEWAFHLLNVDSASINVVPEPGTITMLGLGLAGLGFQARKMRKDS